MPFRPLQIFVGLFPKTFQFIRSVRRPAQTEPAPRIEPTLPIDESASNRDVTGAEPVQSDLQRTYGFNLPPQLSPVVSSATANISPYIAPPEITRDEYQNATPHEITCLLISKLGDIMICRLDEPGFKPLIRAANFLFNLASSDEGTSVTKIARGNPGSEHDRTQFYAGIEIIRFTHCSELEGLLLNLGLDQTLALDLVRRLTDCESYKKDTAAEPPANHRKSKQSVFVNGTQDQIVGNFSRLTSTGIGELDHFLQIHRNGNLTTSLSGDELNNRLLFLESLAKLKLLHRSLTDRVLRSEYEGYRKYQIATHESFRTVADDFLDDFSDPKINNFSMRGIVVEFLDNRARINDHVLAIDFLSDLKVLNQEHKVQNVERLMNNAAAMAKEVSGNQICDKLYGLYYEATAALSLIQNSNGKIKIRSMSTNNLQDRKGRIDEVDIVAEVDRTTHLIEVKNTGYAARGHGTQINKLVLDSKVHSATPVLLIGNLAEIIGRVRRYLSRQEKSEIEGAFKSAIEQINIIHDLLGTHEKDLKIWDEYGNDLTSTIRTIHRQLETSSQVTAKAS